MSTPIHKLPRARHRGRTDDIARVFNYALQKATTEAQAWDKFNMWLEIDRDARDQLATWAKVSHVNGGSDPRHVWFSSAMAAEDAQESLKAPVPIPRPPAPEKSVAEKLENAAKCMLDSSADLEEATDRFSGLVHTSPELKAELWNQCRDTVSVELPWYTYMRRQVQ